MLRNRDAQAHARCSWHTCVQRLCVHTLLTHTPSVGPPCSHGGTAKGKACALLRAWGPVHCH